MTGEPTLRMHDESADGWVEYLQEALGYQLLMRNTGIEVEKTGRFDQQTHDAVVAFQRLLHLQADGVCGDQTWAALRGDPAHAPATDGREPHSFVDEGLRVVTEWSHRLVYSDSRDPQPKGLVLNCVNVGTVAFDNGRYDAGVDLVGPTTGWFRLTAVAEEGQTVDPGEHFWFDSEPFGEVVLEPGDYTYTVTLPAEIGGATDSGSFRVDPPGTP